MTTNRKLKSHVRARAAKTGESYTAARRNLIAEPVPATMTVAAAQMPLSPDPADVAALRENGKLVRALLTEAAAAGARLVHFPEGALVSPHKGVVSVTGPESIGPADWSRTAWEVIEQERGRIATLSGDLRVWTVLGAIAPDPTGSRPTNCLYVISARGEIVGRYDERMLSNTKDSFMYRRGRQPLTFDAGGLRFGCLLGMETHYAELVTDYEERGVDCVLFATAGNPQLPGVFAVEAAGHAAANSIWISYAGPTGADEPAAGLAAPDGSWAARCQVRDAGIAVAEVVSDPQSPARAWRRAARASLRAATP